MPAPKAEHIPELKTIVAGTETFRADVQNLLETIAGTKVGWLMLLYFGTLAPSKVVQSPKENAALVILQYGLKRKVGKDKSAPICTNAIRDWKDTVVDVRYGTNGSSSEEIPLIRLPPEGWTDKPSNLKVQGGKLHGHKDFKEATPLDVVLFHELCHSYLIAAGISPLWETRTNDFDRPSFLRCEAGKVYTAVEEQIVSGLGRGIGLDCCENAYRIERNYPPRTSYVDVGIPDDSTLHPDNFAKTWEKGQSTLREKVKTWGSEIAFVVKENLFKGDIQLFRGAKQVTDQPVRLGLVKPSKLAKTNSNLTIDPEDVS